MPWAVHQGPVVCEATEADAEHLVSPLDGTVSSVTATKYFGLCDLPPSINSPGHYVFMGTDTISQKKIPIKKNCQWILDTLRSKLAEFEKKKTKTKQTNANL